MPEEPVTAEVEDKLAGGRQLLSKTIFFGYSTINLTPRLPSGNNMNNALLCSISAQSAFSAMSDKFADSRHQFAPCLNQGS